MKKNSMFGKLALLFVAVAWGSSMVVIKGSTDTLPAGTLLACRFTVAGLILALANFKKLKQIDKDAWGSSMVVIKGSTDTLPAGTLLACRFTVAGLILALANFKKLKQIDKEYLKSGIFIGVCLFMAYFTQTIGVMLEMPGKSHFLSSAYCVFVPFLGWLILKEKPKIYHILAATMCAVGIILVSVAGNFSISYGDSISIISSVFWAAQIIAIAKWGKDKDPGLITMLQFVVCAILAWVFTLTMCHFSMGIHINNGKSGSNRVEHGSSRRSIISWYCLFGTLFPITDNRTENRKSDKCFNYFKF